MTAPSSLRTKSKGKITGLIANSTKCSNMLMNSQLYAINNLTMPNMETVLPLCLLYTPV